MVAKTSIRFAVMFPTLMGPLCLVDVIAMSRKSPVHTTGKYGGVRFPENAGYLPLSCEGKGTFTTPTEQVE
jgi:hypothetical protein